MAIVYVRQSTQHQVLEHRESTARQYALADRAVALGWPAAAVEVIDEDQGRSGSSAEGRSGFQRLLAEVSSDRVGIILGLEMSRLARSCKDWHALLELCAIYRTLLADADGLYDPSQYNDRLLLGLKGTMSEAELHILKSRLQQGMWNKAERGEVLNHPPIGYVRTPAGDFVIDPDEQVQSVVRMVFDQFARRGSVNGLLRWLAQHDVKLPVRPHFGMQPRGTGVATGEPRHAAGHAASSDLRRRVSMGASGTGSPQEGSRTTDHRANIQAARCMPGADPRPVPGLHHVGRIREQPANSSTKTAARSKLLSAPRHGPSVLAGLVVCGRCGRRMLVGYYNTGRASKTKTLRYSCHRDAIDYGEEKCQSLSGAALESLVVERLPASRHASVIGAESRRG